METPSPDGPADLETFLSRSGRPFCVSRDFSLLVVLLPDRWNTRHGRTGTQLAAGPSQVCVSPSEPFRTDTVQDQGGRGAGPARGALLPDLVPRTDAPRDSPSLADSSEERSTDSETGHPVAPATRPLETSCLVPGPDMIILHNAKNIMQKYNLDIFNIDWIIKIIIIIIIKIIEPKFQKCWDVF